MVHFTGAYDKIPRSEAFAKAKMETIEDEDIMDGQGVVSVARPLGKV